MPHSNFGLALLLLLLLDVCARQDDGVRRFETTGYFVLEYQNLSRGRVAQLVAEVDAIYDSVSTLLGVKIRRGEEKIALKICEDQEEYFEEALKLGASVESAFYSCGITFSDLEAILVYKEERKLDTRIIAHEITHGVINAARGVNNTARGEGRFPLWLHEGIALYCEKFSGEKTEYARQLAAIQDYQKSVRAGFLSFSEIAEAYPRAHEDKVMMYYQCYAVIDYLVAAYGVERFQNFIEEMLLGGLSTSTACRRVFDRDLEELQEEWEASLR